MAELNKKRKWTNKEIEYLTSNYGKFTPNQCAKTLSRTEDSVKHKAIRLNLTNERRSFIPEEIDYIKQHYDSKGPIALSLELNLNRDSICGIARKFGLKMIPEARGEISRQRLIGHKMSQETKEKIGKTNSKTPIFCVDCGKKISRRALRCSVCNWKSNAGERHMWWKGGLTPLYQLVASMLYPVWRYPILCRDLFTCQDCGRHDHLEVHHLRFYNKIRDIIIKRYPELSIKRFEERKKLAQLIVLEHKVEDGITLCHDCHRIYHFEKGDELLGTLPKEDNQHPRLSNVISLVDSKVQRPTLEDTQTNNRDTSVPATCPKVA